MTLNTQKSAHTNKDSFLKLKLQFFSEQDQNAEILGEIKAATGELQKALQKQEDDIKAYGQASDKTVNELKSAEKQMDALNKDFEELKGEMAKMKRPEYQEPQAQKSIGAQFVESENYKNRRDNRYVDPLEVKSFFPGGQKDLVSTDNAGALVTPQRNPNIIAPMDRTLTMRDILNSRPLNSNAIEWVEETGFTNNAGMVAEGSIKPESALEFEARNTSVSTIAHWVPATRLIIEDAQQLRNYIDGRLRYGLKLKEEEQILYGDGSSDNLQGIMTNPNIQTLEAGDYPDGFNKIDRIRRAITRTRVAQLPATGIVLHPEDWEDIELMKGEDGHYIWVNVNDGGVNRLFRVPVVESVAMEAGDYLTGAFGLGAELHDREQANVRVAEQHADFFIRNMVAILAEERLALTTYRPEAFVRGTFGAGE